MPNRGVFVRELDLQEALEVYDIRSSLDELMGRLIAERVTDAQVEAWRSRVMLLQPREVQVTTLDRGTALSGLLPVPAERLEAIAARVRDLGIPAETFPCRDERPFHEGRRRGH